MPLKGPGGLSSPSAGKTRAVFGSHHVGQREPQRYLQDPQPAGLWRQPRRRPRHLRLGWSLASPPPGSRLTSWRCKVPARSSRRGGRGGGRRRAARLHLMEKRGGLALGAPRGEGWGPGEDARRPRWEPRRPARAARGTGSLGSTRGGGDPKETAENQPLGKLPEFLFSAHPGSGSALRPPREPRPLASRWHSL